ncbi:MAG: hypothetical protein NT133_20530 [Alphaproteobacteria bacterium]|nr:hypothetical protein [Alphaproteobacteria bacterium]
MNAFARAGRRLMVEDFDAPPPLAQASPATPHCPCPRCNAEGRAAECPSASYEEGVARGRELRTVQDAQAVETLALELSDALARGTERAAAEAAEAAEALARLVIAAVMAALPASFARLGASEARAIVAAVLPSLASEPSVTIEAAPGALGTIRATIASLPRASQARIHLHANEDGGDDLAIIWSAGQVRRCHADALAMVQDTLAQFGLVTHDDIAFNFRTLETTAHG